MISVLRRHPFLTFTLFFFVWLAFWSRLAMGAPSVPDPVDHPIEFWGMLSSFHASGGLYLAIAVAVVAVSKSLARVFAPADGSVATGWRARAITTFATIAMVVGSLVDLFFGSLSVTGLAVAGVGAAAMLQDPRDIKPKIAKVAIVIALVAGCAQVRTRSENAVHVVLDCNTPALVAAAKEGALLVRASILSAIRDDGKPDTAALRNAGKDLKQSAWQCAFAAALAALASPVPRAADAPQAEGLEIDGEALRLAGRALASREWGVSSVLLPGGAL